MDGGNWVVAQATRATLTTAGAANSVRDCPAHASSFLSCASVIVLVIVLPHSSTVLDNRRDLQERQSDKAEAAYTYGDAHTTLQIGAIERA